MNDKDHNQDEERTITPAGEVELTEKQLDDVNGGYINVKCKLSRPVQDIDDIKPRSPGTRRPD